MGEVPDDDQLLGELGVVSARPSSRTGRVASGSSRPGTQKSATCKAMAGYYAVLIDLAAQTKRYELEKECRFHAEKKQKEAEGRAEEAFASANEWAARHDDVLKSNHEAKMLLLGRHFRDVDSMKLQHANDIEELKCKMRAEHAESIQQQAEKQRMQLMAEQCRTMAAEERKGKVEEELAGVKRKMSDAERKFAEHDRLEKELLAEKCRTMAAEERKGMVEEDLAGVKRQMSDAVRKLAEQDHLKKVAEESSGKGWKRYRSILVREAAVRSLLPDELNVPCAVGEQPVPVIRQTGFKRVCVASGAAETEVRLKGGLLFGDS